MRPAILPIAALILPTGAACFHPAPLPTHLPPDATAYQCAEKAAASLGFILLERHPADGWFRASSEAAPPHSRDDPGVGATIDFLTVSVNGTTVYAGGSTMMPTVSLAGGRDDIAYQPRPRSGRVANAASAIPERCSHTSTT